MSTRAMLVLAVMVGLLGGFFVIVKAEERCLCGTVMSCHNTQLECSLDAHDYARDACFNPDLLVV